jgi:hypothetical protein
MQEDRAWDRIVDAIDTKFGIINHGRDKRQVEDAHELTEHVSFIVFDREGERYKLERVQGPGIVDRKTVGARRAGATVRYQNVYDPEDTSFRTNLYRDAGGGDWEAIDPSALGL